MCKPHDTGHELSHLSGSLIGLLLFLSMLSGCDGGPSESAVVPLTGEYALVFEDQFDGTALNRANWAYDNDVHVNNEQQQYTAENVVVSNGTLKLIPRRETVNGYPFTSGRIYTSGLREFTYGRMVARMRLPIGPGFWPAFWMLGNDINTVGWPTCGEIDIMENVGDADWTSVAIHGPGYSGGNSIGTRVTLANTIDNWHEYRIDWEPGFIEWYVDDRSVFRVESSRVNRGVFTHPYFLILNLALGGDYPFSVNNTSTPYRGLPQATVDIIDAGGGVTEVDWVRVYQRQEEGAP